MPETDSAPVASSVDPIPPMLPIAPAPPVPLRARPRFRFDWTWLALGLILAGHLALVASHFAPAISEPDDNGYFAQGTLWASTGKTWFKAESDAQYVGMHWLITPTNQYISRYPPGLAAVIAVVDLIAGYRATLWINPAFTLLALLGFFFLAKRVVSAGWALVGTLVLAMNPTVIHHALAGDSHAGVACLLVWGIYLLVLWSESGRIGLVFAAGIVLGLIPSIRYADAIIGLGVIFFLLWHWRSFPKIGWHYLAAGIGAAIPMLPLLIRNQELMGAFWRTGYSLTNEETGFSWAYFTEHFNDYIRQINGNAMGLFFALGFVGMLWMIFKGDRRTRRPLGVMMLTMTVAMLVVYMAYYWAPQMNSEMTLRFLLPIYGLCVLGGVCALRELCGTGARRMNVAVGLAVVLFQVAWGTSDLMAQMGRMGYQKESLFRVTRALEKTAHDGDVVIGSGHILQHLDFVRKWKMADGSLVQSEGGGFGGFGGGMGDGNNTPSPRQPLKAKLRSELYVGDETERRNKFAADIKAWAGTGHTIYIVGAETYVKSWAGLGGGSGQIVARVALPPQPGEERAPGQRFGRGPGGGGMRGRRGGFFNGPGGPGGPGGGPMRGFAGETEIVIAEFTLGR